MNRSTVPRRGAHSNSLTSCYDQSEEHPRAIAAGLCLLTAGPSHLGALSYNLRELLDVTVIVSYPGMNRSTVPRQEVEL